ncbi:DUF6380 family protein [Streptomyces sp. NPDC050997]
MDNPVQGDATAGKRHATLRWATASLTATTSHAPFNLYGGRAGEGAR